MVVEKLDYRLFEGVGYSQRNRLCVWVHPLMASVDVGQEIVDDWKNHLDEVAAGDNYCILLLNYKNPNSMEHENHVRRVQPIIDVLRSLQKDKFLELENEFFELNNENIRLLQETFGVRPIVSFNIFPAYQNAHFLTCEVDGLYREDCVSTQRRYLKGISIFPPTLWEGIRYIQ